MPAPIQFLTPDDLAPLEALLRQILAQQQAEAPPADDFLRIDQVAALTNVSVKTVRNWISKGKLTQQRRLVKLFTVEFSPGTIRVPRAALLAFAKAQVFDATHLALPPASAATPPPPKTTRLKQPVLNSEQALRRTA